MFQYKKSSIFFLCLVFFNPVASWQTRKKYKYDIQQLIDLLKRRNTFGSDEIIGPPESVEDLPRAEPLHPGHTLIRPSLKMLKSAVKYPHKDVTGTAVYGNVKNLGITYGKTNARVLYTGFRKANDILTKLLQALNKTSNIRPKKSSNNLVIIELDPLLMKNIGNQDADYSPVRRNTFGSDEIIGPPESVEDLPRAEPIHPGHTLIQPSLGMLKSAVKYPHKDVAGTAVYGNVKNLGNTHGKTNARVLYTGFRKANDLLTKLLQALNKKSNIRPKKSSNNLVIIELDPLLMKNIGNQDADYSPAETNNAIEILDDPNASYEESSYTRRQRKPRISEFRDRRSKETSEEKVESQSGSESSDYEHNPGNPYTVFKDKYKQNWLWNHFMDGHHMNVNPYAPPFNSMGPSGAQLFFGRKWWYFNQDDFKPLN